MKLRLYLQFALRCVASQNTGRNLLLPLLHCSTAECRDIVSFRGHHLDWDEYIEVIFEQQFKETNNRVHFKPINPGHYQLLSLYRGSNKLINACGAMVEWY